MSFEGLKSSVALPNRLASGRLTDTRDTKVAKDTKRRPSKSHSQIAGHTNPIIYVINAMRDIINVGWDSTSLLYGIVASLLLAVTMYALVVISLHV